MVVFHDDFAWYIVERIKPYQQKQIPGDSKWPFDPLVGGHLTFAVVT